MKTRILLADDHTLLRQGVRNMIDAEEDMEVVGEAADGRTAEQLALKLRPDIVIMDISMPGLNGIEATRRIAAEKDAPRVIALSMHIERRMVVEMLNAGASGYLLKDCLFEEVLSAVRIVAARSTYLSPRITDVVLKDYVHRIPKEELTVLTSLSGREREVLQLLAEGKKVKDIAGLLHISVKTAEFHRQKIMEKLDIHTIAELTKFAIREGLTEL